MATGAVLATSADTATASFSGGWTRVPSREPQPATTQPRLWERARGLVGLAGVVTVAGVVVAVLVGLALLIVAIAIVAAFG